MMLQPEKFFIKFSVVGLLAETSQSSTNLLMLFMQAAGGPQRKRGGTLSQVYAHCQITSEQKKDFITITVTPTPVTCTFFLVVFL